MTSEGDTAADTAIPRGQSRRSITSPTPSIRVGFTQRSYTLTGGTAPALAVKDDLGVITVGSDYSHSFKATGDGAVTYTVDSGTLPAGLKLASDGTLSGKATAAEDSAFVVKATSVFGSDTHSYKVTTGAAPAFATRALPAGTVGTAYAAPVVTTGDGAVTVALTKGDLPKGLAFDAKTGVLSGTPTVDASATLTLTASSAYGTTTTVLAIRVAKATEPVTTPEPAKTPELVKTPEPVKTAEPVKTPEPVTSAEPVKTPAPVQTPAPAKPAPVAAAPVLPEVPKATVKLGQAIAISVAASSTVHVTYSLHQSVLPAGLTLNTESGTITGTPKASGTFAFAVKATSSAGSDVQRYTIVVPEKTSVIPVTSSRATPTMDRPFDVTIGSLKKGERWRIAIGSRTIRTGTAAKAGSVTARVELPVTKKDATYVLHVSGSRTVTDASTKASTDIKVTAIAVKKALKVQGSSKVVTVKRLAPNESVTVTEKGRVVATGRADLKGVFSFTPSKLKAGKHKLVAQGVLKGRTASATVKIGR